ncbi:MAG: hypothetical protein AB1566_03360 [Chloroflexota bacterium]
MPALKPGLAERRRADRVANLAGTPGVVVPLVMGAGARVVGGQRGCAGGAKG